MATDPPSASSPTPDRLSVRTLATEAGYRVAGFRDAGALLRLTSTIESDRPGLLGRASRQLPGWLTRPLVLLTISSWLIGGLVIFDPAWAALVVLPVRGMPRRFSYAVALAAFVGVAVLAIDGLAAAIATVSGLDFRDVAGVIAIATCGVPLLLGARRVRAMNRAHRALKATAPGTIVNVGGYFGVPGVAARMAAALSRAADRHGIALLAQTTGEARIRLYRSFGFKVSTIEDPARPGSDARVFLVRYPPGGPHVDEPPEQLWRRQSSPEPGATAGSSDAR